MLILLATVVVYWPARNGELLWDDNMHVTRLDLQSIGGLYRIWFEPGATQQYYPLLHSAFWLEHKLWGDAVLGYHFVNLAWHMLAVSLLYLVLVRLKVSGALLAAAIFALHPVMVESVAWISEQKNTLSAVFYLGAMLAYLGFDESRQPSRHLRALGLFVLGLLTKTVIATLPAALLVLFWWQRGRLSFKRDVLPLIPFFVLAAIAGSMTAWVERTLIGAEGVDFDLSFMQRCLLAGRVVWFYIGKLVWPSNLIFIYPRWDIDPAAWWQWLFPIATLITTAVLVALRKWSRAPLAGWLFLCGTLFPVLGFLNVYPFIYSFVADHFQYLASLGMIVLAASAIAQAITWTRQRERTIAVLLSALLVSSLAVLSFRQSSMYADPVTLYQTTIDRNPDCWMAYNNLGVYFAAKGNPTAAIHNFQEALRIMPNNFAARTNLGNRLVEKGQFQDALTQFRAAERLQPNFAEVHKNIGNALLKMNRAAEAASEYRAALALRDDDPIALNSLGLALIRLGKFPDAIPHLDRAIRLKFDYPAAHNNLGEALLKSGQPHRATDELRIALSQKEGDPAAVSNLGIALIRAGRFAEAIDQLNRALSLDPNNAGAHDNLGIALAAIGQIPNAIQQFREALRLGHKDFSTHNNLGILLSRSGDFDEAIVQFEQAVKMQPTRADFQNNLGEAHQKAGRLKEAVTHFEIARQLNPNYVPTYTNLAKALAAMDQSKKAIEIAEKGVEIAHSGGEDAAAQEIEEWLKHYQIEVRRAAEPASEPQ